MTTALYQDTRRGHATEAQRAAMRMVHGKTVTPNPRERELDQAMKTVIWYTAGGISVKDMPAYPDVERFGEAECPSCGLVRPVLYLPDRRLPLVPLLWSVVRGMPSGLRTRMRLNS